MQYFLYLLYIPFLFLNYKIISSDIKNKIIPNKFLLYLLFIIPLYYIYLLIEVPNINFLLFFLQFFLSFVISFILYLFGIWSAGDAKYLLVLSLFIPHIGILNFIGNIALLTFLYLLMYFIYFYLFKSIFDHTYRRSLFGNIVYDLKERLKYFAMSGDKNIYKGKLILKTIQFILLFLIVFVSIRLSRIYILNSFFQSKSPKLEFMQKILIDYPIYVPIAFLVIIFSIKFSMKYLINKIRYLVFNILKRYNIFHIIFKKYNFNKILFLIILAVLLVSFIIWEYINDPEEIKLYLYKIFTIYLIIFFAVKILIYSYKITFQIGEEYHTHIDNIFSGDIIDKEYLKKIFTFYNPSNNKNLCNNLKTKHKSIISDLDNNLSKDDVVNLKSMYKEYNDLNKDNKVFEEIRNIKVLKTFAFGIYIFLGFLVTYFIQDIPIKYILNFSIDLFRLVFE